VGSEELQTGVTVGRGLSVSCIFGVDVGGGTSVGVAVAGFPQDETITAMARNINNCLFMFNRPNKIFFTREYSTRQRNYRKKYQHGDVIRRADISQLTYLPKSKPMALSQ
jgi:hypothetical protein